MEHPVPRRSHPFLSSQLISLAPNSWAALRDSTCGHLCCPLPGLCPRLSGLRSRPPLPPSPEQRNAHNSSLHPKRIICFPLFYLPRSCSSFCFVLKLNAYGIEHSLWARHRLGGCLPPGQGLTNHISGRLVTMDYWPCPPEFRSKVGGPQSLFF